MIDTTRFPLPASARMIAELRIHVIVDPHPFCVDLEHCAGMWLATIEGDRIFDWAGYYGSKWIAHNHPRLFERRRHRHARRQALSRPRANERAASVRD